MSSGFRKRLKGVWRPWTFGLRLLLGYAALFAASAVVLFTLAYLLFVDFMREPGRGYMEAQAHELTAVYISGGLPGLRAELATDAQDSRREELVVRLADGQGGTLLLYNPDDWKEAELEDLAEQPLPEQEAWLQLGPAEDEDALEAFSMRLADGRVMQVGMDSDLREDVLESVREVFIVIALPVLILALLGGALMAYRALKPVRDLLLTLQNIVDTGDVHERVPVAGAPTEFTELARLFNRMLDRIDVLLAGMRSTLDNVAHDLRTPMTHLRGTAELTLQQERDPAAYKEALADCMEVSETVLTMLNTLMEVAEAEAGAMPLRLETIHVADLVADVMDLYRFVAEEKEVALESRVSPELRVLADPSRLRQVVANLVDNAVKYTAPGGLITLTSRMSGDTCEITVHDTGPGVAEEDLPHIWDRLYRGDRSRSERGLGLGLSLVKAVVEAHGGRVGVESTAGNGAAFTVSLPCVRHGAA